jgi:hypothetical protein
LDCGFKWRNNRKEETDQIFAIANTTLWDGRRVRRGKYGTFVPAFSPNPEFIEGLREKESLFPLSLEGRGSG